MPWIEYIAERRGGWIRLELRPMKLRDWWAVFGFWRKIVWGDMWGTGPMSARTAWEVAEIVRSVVRDAEKWRAAHPPIPDEVIHEYPEQGAGDGS